MENCNVKNITKEVIAELENLVFVQEPNFKNYDYVTINNNFLELFAEEIYEPNDNGQYIKIQDAISRQFKKNGVSGVYVEY